MTDAPDSPDPLDAIAAEPPQFPVAQVADAVRAQFGLQGTLSPLVSERDQNFRLDAPGGERFVVKVTGSAETAAATAIQLVALEHLARTRSNVAPGLVATQDGRSAGEIGTSGDGSRHLLRVVSWIDGVPLAGVAATATLIGRFGARLAELDEALAGLDYDGENPVLLWDLQRAGEVVRLLERIDDRDVRASVARAIDAFRSRALPRLALLPKQVIHGDPNPENVITDAAGTEVVGFIDVGDMVRAPAVVDLAIAASYLRDDGPDPLSRVAALVAGYCGRHDPGRDALELLPELVCARLATTVALLYWRLGERPATDPYRRKVLASESGAARFLAALQHMGRGAFLERLGIGAR